MRTSEYSEELSKCVQCGSCKAYCPTYSEDLTESMSARGRLALLRGLLNRQLNTSHILNERIFSCMLCGACESQCPTRVDITGAIYQGRRILSNLDRRRKYLRMLMRFCINRPMLSFRIARMLQHTLSPYLFKTGKIPFNVSFPHAPLGNEQQVYKPHKKIGRVAVFKGCVINYLYPQLGISLINVLLHLGYEVVLQKGEVCCGEPLRGLGLEEDAVKLAEKNHSMFSKLSTEAVLSLCPTCIVSLNNHYPKLIGKGLNVLDASSFLTDKLKPHQFRQIRNFTTVTYHDPCHLKYSLGISKEPRQIIRNTGAELIEAEEGGCCGFGGTFSLQYKDISGNLLKKSIDAYTNTGAKDIVTSCPGCMLQLDSGLKGKRVYHVIELVEEMICGDSEG